MTDARAMLIFSGLLVIVTIDHPFTGVVKVEPEALLVVIHDLGRGEAPPRGTSTRGYGYCFLMKRLSPDDIFVLNRVGLPPLISAPSNW